MNAGPKRAWVYSLSALAAAAAIGIFGSYSPSADDRTGTEQILGTAQKAASNREVAALVEGRWTVVDSSGTISFVRNGGGVTPVALTAGAIIGPADAVETGADGWALLSHGKDTISISPNSRMALPEKSERGLTRVLQDLGSLLFRVDKKPGRDFHVETPHLVAGVKGTTFGVSVSSSGSSVSVSEGTVGVSGAGDGDGGAGSGVDVTAGQTANVSSEPGSDVNVAPTAATKGPGAAPAAPAKPAGQPGRNKGPGSGNSKDGSQTAARGNSKGTGQGNSGGNAGGNDDAGGNGDGNNGGGNGGGNDGGNNGGGNDGGNNGGGNGGGNDGGNNGNGNGGGNGNGNN